MKTKHCVCHNNTIIHHQADSYNQTSFTKYVKFYIFWVQLHIQVYDHFDTTIFHCLVEIYLMPYKYCIDKNMNLHRVLQTKELKVMFWFTITQCFVFLSYIINDLSTFQSNSSNNAASIITGWSWKSHICIVILHLKTLLLFFVG